MTLSWPVSVALFKLQIAIMWGLWAHYKVVCSVKIEKCVNFMFSCTYLYLFVYLLISIRLLTFVYFTHVVVTQAAAPCFVIVIVSYY